MPIGESQGITLPVVGTTVGPAWATALNAALTTLITSVESAVTPQGFNVNANVEFNNYQALEMGAVGFENKSAAFTGSTNIVKVYVLNGELYFNDANGSAVKITSGGGLNAAALAGIGGDYGGSNAASMTFTESTSTYTLLESAALRAILDCGQILIRESLTSGYAVKLTNPGGMAGDVTRTFAAALPASTSLVTCTSAGVEAFTRDPSVDSLTITDPAVKHASQFLPLPLCGGAATGGLTSSDVSLNAGNVFHDFGTVTSWRVPVPLPVGAHLTGITVYGKNSNASTQALVRLLESDLAGAESTLATLTSTSSTSTQSWSNLALNATVANNTNLCIGLSANAATDHVDFYGLFITYDTP